MKQRLLHVTLFLVGLMGTAELIRGIGAGYGDYASGGFYTPDGTKVPIAEIANYLTGGGHLGGSENVHPSGRLTPGLRVKQGYDRPRWEYFDAQGCILIEHNSLGFRDVEFPVEKPAGEFRVLALGDSFTYGSGVRMQDAWSEVLERRLASGGRKVQVINCGFAAGTYAPAGYDTWMVSDGLLLQPDLVIVGFCLNDMGNGNDIPMLSYQGVTTAGYPFALLDQFMTAYQNRQAKANVPDFTAVVQAHPETWNATQDALRNLQRILAGKQIPFVVAVIPMLSQLDGDPYPYEGLHHTIGEFCAAEAILCVDLKGPFLGRNELDLWVHPTDQHHNHIGQEMLGEGVFAFLRERGLTPK